MTDKLISGKELAALQKENIKKEVSRLNRQGIYPKLSVIIVGDNPRSLTYVKGKHKDCAECGIISENIEMPENVSQDRLKLQGLTRMTVSTAYWCSCLCRLT